MKGQETAVSGGIPRYELTEWREKYGVTAGITVRPFDLGLWGNGPSGEVMARWRQFRDGMGFSRYVLGHQCHGVGVSWAHREPHEQPREDPRAGPGEATVHAVVDAAVHAASNAAVHAAVHAPNAAVHAPTNSLTILDRTDGHATDWPDTCLLVTVADCIPVYLLEPKKKVIALLHSGWRGTAAGILGKGIALLRERAEVEPKDLVMHLGVGICGQCYEVGAEVIEGVGLRADGDGPWHVDLRERLAYQARQLGVTDISISEHCTAHENGLFFSHRASGGKDGRMVAYLGVGASEA